MSRRAIVYARLSVKSEESVSIERQLAAGRKYCESRGWTVVDEAIDEGVSATFNRPEDRVGWKAVLTHPEEFDAVVLWRVDRLARRVLDFLNADAALQKRGAGIVSVEEPIDMTTAQGRAFATMLAVFAELEAAGISARVSAARNHLIKAGRVVGGTVPYGWRSIPNPNGPGKVLAHDPERIPWVRGMVSRAMRGDSIYAIKAWLDGEGAPLPLKSQKTRKRDGWNYRTIERILRSPILAGMTPYQPGRGRRDPADPHAVLRDDQGLPVVEKSWAIISPDERRSLIVLLDSRNSPQVRPRASQGVTSPLLSQVARCAYCDRFMARGTTQGRPSLRCPECSQVISRPQLEAVLVKRLLGERGHVKVWEEEAVQREGIAARLAEIEQAITDTTASMQADDADMSLLGDRLANLKSLRAQARSESPFQPVRRWTGHTVESAWEAAVDDSQRRAVLLGQVATLKIQRGKVGRYLDPDRILLRWRPEPSADALPEALGHLVPSKVVEGERGIIGSPLILRTRNQVTTFE